MSVKSKFFLSLTTAICLFSTCSSAFTGEENEKEETKTQSSTPKKAPQVNKEGLKQTQGIDTLKKRIARFTVFEKDMSVEPLSYREFKSLRDQKHISSDQAKELIDYAEEIGNPILFRESDKVVDFKDYSINLLWIHEKNVTKKGHLFGNDDKSLTERVISPIKDWNTKQPQAFINFWYDPNRLPDAPNAIEETHKHLQASEINLNTIVFKSIRGLKIVQDNPNLFIEKVPIYFRVDFSKILIGDHMMCNNNKYVVNVDCDIAAVNRAQLFNARSLMLLEELGYVFADLNGTQDENSFVMLRNHDSIRQLHKEVMIDKVLSKLKDLNINININSQTAFEEYRYFKEAVRKNFMQKDNKMTFGNFYTSRGYKGCSSNGLSLVGPRSKFGMDLGYKPKEIEILRKALADPEINK